MTDEQIQKLAEEIKRASVFSSALGFLAKHPVMRSSAIGAGIGAGVGGVADATSEKGTFLGGALKGALVGGGLGAGVGALKTPKGMNLLGNLEKKFPHPITQRSVTTEAEKAIQNNQRTFFGMGGKAKLSPFQETITNPEIAKGNMITRTVGEGTHNLGRLLKDPVGYLKHEYGTARTFVGKDKRRYMRSPLGQVANVAMTGPGIAATSTVGALMSNDGESKANRIGIGVAEGALWSVAPRLGMASMIGRMGYDILKSKKPQQTTIQNDTNIIQ